MHKWPLTSSKKQQEVPCWRRTRVQRVLLQIRLLSTTTGFDEAEVSQRAIHPYGILYLVESVHSQ